MRMPWRPHRDGRAPWPVVLRDSRADPAIVLRPLRIDRRGGVAARAPGQRRTRAAVGADPAAGLRPRTPVSFRQFVRDLDTEARADRAMPWAIEVGGRIVGQVHIFGIIRAAQQSRVRPATGCRDRRPVTASRPVRSRWRSTTRWGRPGCTASRSTSGSTTSPRSVSRERLGLRDEGIRERYLHIDGAWRDHRSFAVTTEDLGGATLTDRLSQQ